MARKKYVVGDGQMRLFPLMEKVARKVPVKSKINKDFPPEQAERILNSVKKREEEKYGETDEQRMARREKIIEIKKTVREMEKDNRDKVILFPSFSRNPNSQPWYKMGDISALYYAYRMADRMGRVVRLTPDTDNFAKMTTIASIGNLDMFLKLAEELGDFSRIEKSLLGIYILHLKKPLTDEDLMALRRTEDTRREMMHSVLKPKQADAAVYQAILMLDRQLLPRLAVMDRGYFLVVGETIAKCFHMLTQTYFKFADGLVNLATAKSTMRGYVAGISAGMALIAETQAWGYDTVVSIGENINNLKRLIDKIE